MDVAKLSKNSCRLCLSEGDFNVSLFGNYARRTNIIEKIQVCLKVVIDDGDLLTTICYKCAGNVERYYDFITVIKKSQNRLKFKKNERYQGFLDESFNRHVSYVREDVVEADNTFSFLENFEEKKEKSSSHLFSYISAPKVIAKNATDVWKTPGRFSQDKTFERDVKSNKKVSPIRNCSRDLFECSKVIAKNETDVWKTPGRFSHDKKFEREVKSNKKVPKIRNCSRDLFETQSQEEEPKSLDWKLTPDDNIIKRIREKIFGWPK